MSSKLQHPSIAIWRNSTVTLGSCAFDTHSSKKTLPSLYKKEDETYAEALVPAFEAKFVDIKMMQQPYSPCRLWTNKARMEAGIGKDSKFTAWCCAYFAVREIIKGDPKNIHQKLTSLRKLGTESKPSNMKGGWSDLASSIATRYL
jgi:hypothetical protein